jgi:hypothetical protein
MNDEENKCVMKEPFCFAEVTLSKRSDFHRTLIRLSLDFCVSIVCLLKVVLQTVI